jgi:hypothetical protein
MIRTDLLKKVKDITASGLPFMEGKEKSALVEGALYKITNVGYLISDENKEFVVLADEDNFYFGGSVVTDAFKKLEATVTEDELAELLSEGIEIKISKKMSKAKRSYTTVEFFPE